MASQSKLVEVIRSYLKSWVTVEPKQTEDHAAYQAGDWQTCGNCGAKRTSLLAQRCDRCNAYEWPEPPSHWGSYPNPVRRVLSAEQTQLSWSLSGFRTFLWWVCWLFIVASVVGVPVLLVQAPSCDTLVSSTFRSTGSNCDTRNYYYFAVLASGVSAALFAVVLLALAYGLDSLSRIENALRAMGAKENDAN